MAHPSSKPESGAEKSARKLRKANEAGEDADHRHSADAQNELNSPGYAKGRPATGGGQSNAGNDGGA